MRLFKQLLITGPFLLVFACSGGDSETTSTALYSATCEQACSKQANCNDEMGADLNDCVVDCQTEPWAGNYRECRARTCGLSEQECERFGVKTCDEACTKQVDCGDVPNGERDSCVADCGNEPWPGSYVDCKASLCGASEAQCERFTGQ